LAGGSCHWDVLLLFVDSGGVLPLFWEVELRGVGQKPMVVSVRRVLGERCPCRKLSRALWVDFMRLTTE
jgi:hypothetical protein